jgi:hypothetical protein
MSENQVAPKVYGDESVAVQTHLAISQSVIQRMATNSASCKTWCVTLVAGILVSVADKGKPNLALIALVPTALFLVLDTYYLALERCFRTSYGEFINKMHVYALAPADLCAISPSGSVAKAFFKALRSFSVWPFYMMLLIMILLMMLIIR